jgi:cytochrome c-type biogenesis protein CcmH
MTRARTWRASLALAGMLVLAGPSLAVQPDEVLPNAALEQRARQISGGLRCLVCQNQSIDESDAPLARDLRVLVRERLVAGDSDAAVRDFVVARYGDFVLLSPPVNIRTILLWAAPFLILLTSLAYIGRRTRRMATPPGAVAPLTDEERRRVDQAMRDERG